MVGFLWRSDQFFTDVYLTTHNNHNRQTAMTPVGFEPAIPASKQMQSQALGCATTGIGN